MIVRGHEARIKRKCKTKSIKKLRRKGRGDGECNQFHLRRSVATFLHSLVDAGQMEILSIQPQSLKES